MTFLLAFLEPTLRDSRELVLPVKVVSKMPVSTNDKVEAHVVASNATVDLVVVASLGNEGVHSPREVSSLPLDPTGLSQDYPLVVDHSEGRVSIPSSPFSTSFEPNIASSMVLEELVQQVVRWH